MDDRYNPESIFKYIETIKYDSIDAHLPLDKWDFIFMAVAGTLGALADLVLGRAEGFPEPKIKNDSIWGLGKHLKEYDIKKNPIDFQEPGAFGGDHRLYSYGHDLLRFFNGVRQTMTGEYVGISSVQGGVLNNVQSGYQNVDFKTALIMNILHLFKDYFTKRSLPIPGMSLLANFNGDKMPEFAEKLYIDNGFNLRVLSGQVLSVAVIEIILRVYLFIRYYKSGESKKAIEAKRTKMLFFTHSFAMLFNLGKVIVTKNPFMLNTGQLITLARYLFKIVQESLDYQKKLINNKLQGVEIRRELVSVCVDQISCCQEIWYGYEEMDKNYALQRLTKDDIISDTRYCIGDAEEIKDIYSMILKKLKQERN